jgi:hypothetical protein
MDRSREIIRRAIVLAAAWMAAAVDAAGADVMQDREALAVSHGQELAKLADWCDEQGLKPQAQTTRGWHVERDPGKLYLFDPPEQTEPLAAEAGQHERQWHERFTTLRKKHAEALVRLAIDAARQRRGSLVGELLLEALREDPDHKQARAALGFMRTPRGWQTPFEARQHDAGKQWHERFGWLPSGHAARYEKGERFYRNRWMSAAEEAALRSNMARGWRIETAHYVVTTNHSLEEGVLLARRLEKLYDIWQNTFPSYLASHAQLERRLVAGQLRPESRRRHNVVYYRTRQEYNDALRDSQPRIEITLGIYFDKDRIAYFFAGQDQDPGTLYHEATHQLFQETRPVAKAVGRESNFWLIEAVACYMESLAEHEGYVTLGGAEAGRMPAARERLLADNFYLPLGELVTLGMNDLQRDARLPKLYSQSAGLAAFLMHGQRGKYREAFSAYLDAVYAGRADAATLSRLAGADYAELDRQYREFLMKAEGGGRKAEEQRSALGSSGRRDPPSPTLPARGRESE